MFVFRDNASNFHKPDSPIVWGSLGHPHVRSGLLSLSHNDKVVSLGARLACLKLEPSSDDYIHLASATPDNGH